MRLSRLGRILSAEGELQPLVAKTRELEALAEHVCGFLPTDLARQVRVANFREGELVLLVANPAVASKLRLLAPALSRYFGQQRVQVKSISLKVQPSPSRKRDSAPQHFVELSTNALDSLRNLYDRMGESPARKALRSLLKRRGALEPASPSEVPRQQTGPATGPSRKGNT